jgi:hypothetical protein
MAEENTLMPIDSSESESSQLVNSQEQTPETNAEVTDLTPVSKKSRKSQIATNPSEKAAQARNVAQGMRDYDYKLKRFTAEELEQAGLELATVLSKKTDIAAKYIKKYNPAHV